MNAFDRLRALNAKRCERFYHPVEQLSNCEWMNCVHGETGELAHLFKDALNGAPVGNDAIAGEIADVIIYLDLLAAANGIDLGRAVQDKFNEVNGRVGFQEKLEFGHA